MKICSNIVDIENREIYPACVEIVKDKIVKIKKNSEKYDTYLLAGFIDSHIHIESSMLIPSEFAKIASTFGTVATVSDPHEIANVLGVEGVDFMIQNAKKTPFKIFFGVPSCVPATSFETSGASLGVEEVRELLQRDEIKYLSEMMNFPGVIFEDKEVISKLKIAQELNKKIDGHAPNLRGEDLSRYIKHKIETDHESFSYEEAKEKLEKGMKILIREGSGAKNFDALIPLIDEYSDFLMFCSDDKHPNDLVKGSINRVVKEAIKRGYNLFDVLKVACINPIKHYKLDVGRLREADKADFIEVDNLKEFNVLKTYIDGILVAKNSKPLIKSQKVKEINNFHTFYKEPKEFEIVPKGDYINVINAIDRELITKKSLERAKIVDKKAVSDTKRDILKIALINRYKNQKPQVAFIKNFNLKKGAIASSIAHDSHNIIAVGCSDKEISKAVNLIIKNRGGISVVEGEDSFILPLNIAGIMSSLDGYFVAKEYEKLDKIVKNNLKSTLTSPFMTLSFMALLVIPEIKLSDKGLFDGNRFDFIELFVKKKF